MSRRVLVGGRNVAGRSGYIPTYLHVCFTCKSHISTLFPGKWHRCCYLLALCKKHEHLEVCSGTRPWAMPWILYITICRGLWRVLSHSSHILYTWWHSIAQYWNTYLHIYSKIQLSYLNVIYNDSEIIHNTANIIHMKIDNIHNTHSKCNPHTHR